MRAASSSSARSRDTFRQPAAPLYAGADLELAEPRQQGRVSGHSRPRALAPAAAGRLRVPSALRARRWTSADRVRPEVADARRRPRCRLPSVSRRGLNRGALYSKCAMSRRVYARGLVGAEVDRRACQLFTRARRRQADDPDRRRRERQRQDDAGDAAARLHRADDGRDHLSRPGHLGRSDGEAKLAFRREVQAVFQDPFAVFNPFYTVDHLLDRADQEFQARLDRNNRRAPRWTNA